MFGSYQDTLNYLYSNLPMFQRIGAAAFNKDLTNTVRLCEALGNPQHKFKSVHVAGTNGKGSTSHMIASVLQSSGYRTGLYTSPHLKDFTERIKINGQDIDRNFIVDFVNRIHPSIEEIQPSFFEITVVMAFDYFVQRNVDIAVIEVGMGGRLDSTNVVTPELSLITNIGWDHKEFLGDTLEKIAAEKGGIVKSGIPVIVSERQPGIEDVFRSIAKESHAPIYFASDEYQVIPRGKEGEVLFSILKNEAMWMDEVFVPMQGYYQRKNILGVVKALEVLTTQGWSITPDTIRDGLKKTLAQTGLKGRWQKLGDHPLIICDTGHNVDGIREVVAQIKAQHYDTLYIILGMVKDKDIREVLHLLPKEATYYFCQANIPRALDANLLADQASEVGLSGEVVVDVNEALGQAKARANEKDMIFIGGSTFVVAEIAAL